jgi:hypothetical protein
VLGRLCAGEGNQARARARRAAELQQAAGGGVGRVLCLSDLHVDQSPANLAWLQSLSSSAFQRDVLVVAGEPCMACSSLRLGPAPAQRLPMPHCRAR